MKIRIFLASLLLVFFIFHSWSHCVSQAASIENMNKKKLEKFLNTARIVSKRRTGGRGENWEIRLDDGKMKQRGFFKLMNRPRPHPIPDCYKYGIAAYELDKLLDFNMVPPVVEREIDGRKGSLQLFIEDYLTEEDRRIRNIEPPDLEKFNKTMEELTVFENLTYSLSLCAERELDDILIMHREDWKVWRVDFSEAFFPIPELIPSCEITRCSKKLYQNLLKLDDKVVKAKLKNYLNDEEMSTLLERKRLIIEKIKQLIKEKGEESVLFS